MVFSYLIKLSIKSLWIHTLLCPKKKYKSTTLSKKVINKELNGNKAAKLLSLTSRHIRRLKKRVKEKGIKGLIHGNRGKSGNRAIQDEEK